MYKQIKQLADEALAVQNKTGMETALRAISDLCIAAPEIGPGIMTGRGMLVIEGAHNPGVHELPCTEIKSESSAKNKKGGAK